MLAQARHGRAVYSLEASLPFRVVEREQGGRVYYFIVNGMNKRSDFALTDLRTANIVAEKLTNDVKIKTLHDYGD